MPGAPSLAVLGFRPHTYWTAVVALAGRADAPHVIVSVEPEESPASLKLQTRLEPLIEEKVALLMKCGLPANAAGAAIAPTTRASSTVVRCRMGKSFRWRDERCGLPAALPREGHATAKRRGISAFVCRAFCG